MSARAPSIGLLFCGLLAATACGDNDTDPCLCSPESPGLNIRVDWDEESCAAASFSFGIRSDEAILTFANSRCTEPIGGEQPLSAIFDWPKSWFDGDVVQLRYTTQDAETIAHSADTLVARKQECVVKVLTPACVLLP